MKTIKNMMIALMMCLTSLSFGQIEYATFNQSYGETNLKIDISGSDTTNYNIYLAGYSLDRYHKEGGVLLDQKSKNDFVNLLKDAKTKYLEWIVTAKENGITDLDKKMEFKFKTEGYFLYYKEWKFDNFVNMSFRFKIIGEKRLLIFQTDEMVSSSNQFMKHDGFAFVFSNQKEIDEFCDILSSKNINDFLMKPKEGDLFK
jgi:hypothetical protein